MNSSFPKRMLSGTISILRPTISSGARSQELSLTRWISGMNHPPPSATVRVRRACVFRVDSCLTDLVGSLFLHLIQGRLSERRRVRSPAALLARTGPVLYHVNHCLTGFYDCRVAIYLVSIEVFPCLSHGRWRPALLPLIHA